MQSDQLAHLDPFNLIISISVSEIKTMQDNLNSLHHLLSPKTNAGNVEQNVWWCLFICFHYISLAIFLYEYHCQVHIKIIHCAVFDCLAY